VPLTKEKAKENLTGLLAKFERELAAHKIREYNEEAAKTAFIQPLLKDVLGWDVNDRDEVSPEEKISRGRVDYGLKIEGKTKIFVEAKPPREDLSHHIDQAVRYGYNRKGVPFVLLTDFEGIKLFDVTIKPDVRNPLKGLKLDLGLGQYLNKFDQLWQLSRESVAAGILDELLRVKPKDRLPVDKAILEDLKRWREILAKDIFKNNPELFHSGDPEKDANYLREITQKILDRIIFMRSCEDRALYHGRSLKEIFDERTDAVGTGTMVFLKKEFESYNIFFDSDLFSPREWEAKLALDFKVMREIILDTYNPYQFDVIPLEVLGNIYEQFLGYTIRLTEHQVKYELKPAVRKAGGVYYTPEYIVDYIVKNTIGKMLQDLPEGKAKKLRILDPACGSGSFLIRAYDEMLKYYQEQKTRKVKPREGEKKLGLPEEKLRLSIDEKKSILIQHIFGVDLDEQAVEVTRLSLMLKMLDGEHGVPAGRGILPMLDKNIKCGNSLISGNILELHSYFGEDWYKVKPFNWDIEFHKIIKEEGGFDAVIGNPPYVRQESLGAQFKEYAKNSFTSYAGTADLYIYFIEKAHSLLREGGSFGMICSNKFMRANYGKPLRSFLSARTSLIEIVDFGELPVFENAATFPAIVLTQNIKTKKQKFIYAPIKNLNFHSLEGEVIKTGNKLDEKSLSSDNWTLAKAEEISIFEKMKKNGIPLGEYVKGKIFYGIKTGLNEAFVVDRETRNRLIHEDKKSAEIIKPFVVGDDIRKYHINYNERYLIFTRHGIHIHDYPAIERHLSYFKDRLMPRPKEWKGKQWTGRKPGLYKWYEIQDTIDYYEELEKPKIIWPEIAKESRFAVDYGNYYLNKTCFFAPIDDLYLVGILNSKTIWFFLKRLCSVLGDADKGGRLLQQKIYVETIPVHVVDQSNQADKAHNARMAKLVESILTMQKQVAEAKSTAQKEIIQRQIAATDAEIDQLVYELYGLTKDEIKIVEGETK
jgi:type I restriction-modification system DNA methylase subunit